MPSPRSQPVLMALLLIAKGEQPPGGRARGLPTVCRVPDSTDPPPPARQEDAGAAASPRPPPAHFPPMYSEQVSLSLGRAGRRQPMCSRLCRSRTAAAWGRRIARTPPSPAFRLKQQMAKLCLHLRALRAVPPGDAFWLAPLGLNAASSPLSYFPFLPSPPQEPPQLS